MKHPWLTQRYNELCAEPSDINEHLPTFVQAVENMNATRVLELGVRYGVSAIAWIYALEEKGHFWGVDCSFPVAAPGSEINNLDPQGPLGVRDHWNFILGDFHSQGVLNLLPKEVDILFIDGNHVFEETLKELKDYFPRVREGGRIYLHDTDLATTGNAVTPQPPYPVRTAMEQFCAEHDLKYENNPRNSGLGLIYC